MITGVGIHSGERCRVTLHRYDGPLAFRRGAVDIPALLPNVIGWVRATSLGVGGARVQLVEHLLAALRIHGFFSGVLIEASADELPILDGSAEPWSAAIAELGDPPPPPPPLTLERSVEVSLKGGVARLEPGEEELLYSIDFTHPAIGQQSWQGTAESYRELLAARTFGLLSEWETLRAHGLALGAAESHAIVFADDGPMRPLRFPNEPARHKALDAIGDLALLGRPLAAKVHLHRGSHALHHAVMRTLMAGADAEVRAS